MVRPITPQVIPRPADWEMGDRGPWADGTETDRTGITLRRVLEGLAARGQRGALPAEIGADRVVGPTMVIYQTHPLADRAINAAVLVVLFEEDGEARLIFTRRSTSLRTHRGQVSFPGGRLDPGEDPPSAALREAYEEIALDSAQVTTEGWLHPSATLAGSRSLIMPIVASVPDRPKVEASPAEVDRVFDVSLRDLAHPENFHEERWRVPGRIVPGSPDNSFTVWFFEVEGEMIWGATARIIYELLQVALVPPHVGHP